jgi:hypothetical protein
MQNDFDLIEDFFHGDNNREYDKNIGVIADNNVKQEHRVSYKQRIDNSKLYDDYYVDVINTVRIVSWQLMNKTKSFARSTIISRLNRLVDKKLIKRAKNGLYHSLDYKSSRNDRHNLWIASVILSYSNDYEFEHDIDILKDENSKFRFSRLFYNDNFVSDLVSIKDGNVVAYEIELTVKTGLQNKEQLKNKVRAYVDCCKKGQFANVYYYTDNNRVKKQIEYWRKYFEGEKYIEIKMSNDEKMMIK